MIVGHQRQVMLIMTPVDIAKVLNCDVSGIARE